MHAALWNRCSYYPHLRKWRNKAIEWLIDLPRPQELVGSLVRIQTQALESVPCSIRQHCSFHVHGAAYVPSRPSHSLFPRDATSFHNLHVFGSYYVSCLRCKVAISLCWNLFCSLMVRVKSYFSTKLPRSLSELITPITITTFLQDYFSAVLLTRYCIYYCQVRLWLLRVGINFTQFVPPGLSKGAQ
jgi:hypothetical protein